MRNLSLIQWLLLIPSLLALLLSLAVSALVLSFAPPGVGIAAGLVLAVLVLWGVLRRRGGASVASESSMLRQSSKEGLL